MSDLVSGAGVLVIAAGLAVVFFGGPGGTGLVIVGLGALLLVVAMMGRR